MKRSAMKRRPPKDRKAAEAFRIAVLNRDLFCRVPECPKPAEVAHHIRGGGMGHRDHSLSNGLGLCFNHHTGDEGVHTFGRETWALKFFGCHYWEIHG